MTEHNNIQQIFESYGFEYVENYHHPNMVALIFYVFKYDNHDIHIYKIPHEDDLTFHIAADSDIKIVLRLNLDGNGFLKMNIPTYRERIFDLDNPHNSLHFFVTKILKVEYSEIENDEWYKILIMFFDIFGNNNRYHNTKSANKN